MKERTPILNVRLTQTYYRKPLDTREDVKTHGLAIYYAEERFKKHMYITIEGLLLPGYQEHVDEIHAELPITPQVELFAKRALQQKSYDPIKIIFNKRNIEVHEKEKEFFLPYVQKYLSQITINNTALHIGAMVKRELLETPIFRIPTKEELEQKREQYLRNRILEKYQSF